MADVDFFGERFTVGPVQQFSLLEFSEAADEADDNGVPVAAAMMRLLREAIDAADWSRFRATAKRNNASGDDLLPVIEAAVRAMDERPTSRSSDSSAGPADTASRSVSPSVAKVLEQEAGRPDRQMGILRSA